MARSHIGVWVIFHSCIRHATLIDMKKRIVANWKMNPSTPSEAKKIFTAIKKSASSVTGIDICVCPPAVFLSELSKQGSIRGVTLGAQDVFSEDTGAYTGQTSPKMVQSYKAKLSIIGHSERRERGEDNTTVGKKAKHCIASGMTALVCVGERTRSDEGEYYTFIRDELEAVLSELKKKDIQHLVLAYEPVWAIGKGATEALEPSALYEMVLFLRKVITERFGRTSGNSVPILYGGSVKPENAKTFVHDGGVDGLLVGSASLDAKQFIAICKEASNRT